MSDLVHSDFDLAFTPGVRVEGAWGETWETAVESVGLLHLRTGGVVVGDPLTGGLSSGPLARQVDPGRYPVEVALVQRPVPDQRTTAARVVFSDAPVDRWERALFPGQDDLPPDQIPGYGVDAGTGCFGCMMAAPALDTEGGGERLLEAMQEQGGSTWVALGHPDAPEDAVVFTTGWGDGFYGSWWGLAEDGTPAMLVTDFELLIVPVWETFTLDLPLPRGRVDHPLVERVDGRLWRPLLGWQQLRGSGPTVPRVRVLVEGQEPRLVGPERTLHGVVYRLRDAPVGARLEIAYSVGERPAQRVE